MADAGGELSTASRDKYASLFGLPLPGSGRVTDTAKSDSKNTCVDVCAEFTGVTECQTRCASDPRDKKHACREACQTAFGTACDRAFPASGRADPQTSRSASVTCPPAARTRARSSGRDERRLASAKATKYHGDNALVILIVDDTAARDPTAA